MAFVLSSSAFQEGQTIPKQYTCDGDDVSPPLSWSGAPAQTKSFALITEDPDAPSGTFVHWVLYDLSAGETHLKEGLESAANLGGGARQGHNGFGKIGYRGPCPPLGRPHRYFFKIYALDQILGLKSGATKADLERATQGHVLAQAQLMGTYGRARS